MRSPEEVQQFFEIEKLMIMPGWGHLVQLWNVQREMIIKSGSEAIQAGDKEKAAYCMAVVAGFDKCTRVASNCKREIEDLAKAELEKAKEKRGENDAQG